MNNPGHFIYKFILFFFLSLPAHANSLTELNFSNGIKSFKAGDYLKAIKHFKAAEEKGLKTASLYFNLGSSYYKAEKYKQSEIVFIKLRKFPKMRTLASYNLGLIYKNTNNEQHAIQWFRKVIKVNDSAKLSTLASLQIDTIKSDKKLTNKLDRWNNYAYLSLGNDSNINVAPSDTALNQSDSFASFYINSEYLISGSISDAWLANASFYHIDYTDFNNNNESQYSLSLKRKLKKAEWLNQFVGKLTKSTYNSADYQTTLSLEASTSRKITKENKFKLRYRYKKIDSDNVLYNYLEGNKQQLRAEIKTRKKTYRQKYYYEYEVNDRQDTSSLSYSPTRHTLKIIHSIKVNNSVDWGGELSYRISDYPVIATTDRDSTRWKYGIFGSYRFDKKIKLKAKFTHTDNASDSLLYEYGKNVFRLTLSRFF